MSNLSRILGGDCPETAKSLTPTGYTPPTILQTFKERRDILASELAKTDEAIAALESNPEVATLLEKVKRAGL